MADPIPKARLQQIAQRKLAALGVPFKVAGDVIRGDLATGAYGLKHPGTGARIETIRFEVEGHDRLRILEPANLRELAPLPFYDHESIGAVVTQLASTLEKRHAAAQNNVFRMKGVGLEATIDPDRLVAQAKIELAGSGVALLEGDDRGIFATRLLAGPGSTRAPVSLGDQIIDLRDLSDRVDLELYLGSLADRALQAEVPSTTAAPGTNPVGHAGMFTSLGEIHAGDDSLEGPKLFAAGLSSGPPRGSGNATFAPLAPPAGPRPGPAFPVNVDAFSAPEPAPFDPPIPAAFLQQAYAVPASSVATTPAPLPAGPAPTLGPARNRAAAPTALPTIGLEALARAFGADAAVSGPITVARELTVGGHRVRFVARQESGRSFVARISGATGILVEVRFDLDGFGGIEALIAQRLGIAAAPAPPAAPVPGTTWAMDVRVERDDGIALHYVMLTASGQSAGSPRALRRPEFEATFSIIEGRPRLLARIVEVSGAQVGYVQLDPRRQPVGGARRSSLTSFLTTFRPES